MAHAFNSSTWKADAGGFLLSSRPAWSAKQVPGQQRATQRNPISNQPTNQPTNNNKKKTRNAVLGAPPSSLTYPHHFPRASPLSLLTQGFRDLVSHICALCPPWSFFYTRDLRLSESQVPCVRLNPELPEGLVSAASLPCLVGPVFAECLLCTSCYSA